LLPSGDVLGVDIDNGTESELYDPTTGSWSLAGSTIVPLPETACYEIGPAVLRPDGDDAQMATNYPIIRIVNQATKDVYYCRTHNHSTMGVATGATIVSTEFDIPSTVPAGTNELFVVANGIPSKPKKVIIAAAAE
jgi:hypothetical protein